MFNYPVKCKQEKKLKFRLRASHAIDNPSGINFPSSIYNIIKSTQPFAYEDVKSDWLTLIVDISNFAKHDRQRFLMVPNQINESTIFATDIEKELKIEGCHFVMELLRTVFEQVDRILSEFYKVIVTERGLRFEYEDRDTLSVYPQQSKILLDEQTTTICHLNTNFPKPLLFGVRDRDYHVDAVMKVEDYRDYRLVKQVQQNIKYGRFFRSESQSLLFVLEKINSDSGLNLIC